MQLKHFLFFNNNNGCDIINIDGTGKELGTTIPGSFCIDFNTAIYQRFDK
jgi:hypothetical protein